MARLITEILNVPPKEIESVTVVVKGGYTYTFDTFSEAFMYLSATVPPGVLAQIQFVATHCTMSVED